MAVRMKGIVLVDIMCRVGSDSAGQDGFAVVGSISMLKVGSLFW